jgi:hypothetical protein
MKPGQTNDRWMATYPRGSLVDGYRSVGCSSWSSSRRWAMAAYRLAVVCATG